MNAVKIGLMGRAGNIRLIQAARLISLNDKTLAFDLAAGGVGVA